MNTRLILLLFLFILVNVGLVLAHLAIFRTSVPYLSWATGVLHIVLLITFPYKSIIRKNNQQ
ncbi:MAG: hypothetical protein P0Y53_20410 [Candidatus Pseudobacter hemicellulosilyticus]|uniref:Uncharacterized protein n=1 Tax=Candidatus Pseudobacter hemicellulosilyticus TaxID=3121375 RepID=A0AAJ5WQG9_9BACT|nr:MAG: hypothetical protein P0Y53_20410 [Pseudobacter sp.]